MNFEIVLLTSTIYCFIIRKIVMGLENGMPFLYKGEPFPLNGNRGGKKASENHAPYVELHTDLGHFFFGHEGECVVQRRVLEGSSYTELWAYNQTNAEYIYEVVTPDGQSSKITLSFTQTGPVYATSGTEPEGFEINPDIVDPHVFESWIITNLLNPARLQ